MLKKHHYCTYSDTCDFEATKVLWLGASSQDAHRTVPPPRKYPTLAMKYSTARNVSTWLTEYSVHFWLDPVKKKGRTDT